MQVAQLRADGFVDLRRNSAPLLAEYAPQRAQRLPVQLPSAGGVWGLEGGWRFQGMSGQTRSTQGATSCNAVAGECLPELVLQLSAQLSRAVPHGPRLESTALQHGSLYRSIQRLLHSQQVSSKSGTVRADGAAADRQTHVMLQPLHGPFPQPLKLTAGLQSVDQLTRIRYPARRRCRRVGHSAAGPRRPVSRRSASNRPAAHSTLTDSTLSSRNYLL